MNNYQLSQINVARIKGVNINDPVMTEFVDNLEKINGLAENSRGFVWRLKDDSNSSVYLKVYDDEQVIINISVWEDIESLENFVYKTFHTDLLKRRKEWFQKFGSAHIAMWWIESGKYPSVEESINRLEYLQKNGASEIVFDFRNKYDCPKSM